MSSKREEKKVYRTSKSTYKYMKKISKQFGKQSISSNFDYANYLINLHNNNELYYMYDEIEMDINARKNEIASSSVAALVFTIITIIFIEYMPNFIGYLIAFPMVIFLLWLSWHIWKFENLLYYKKVLNIAMSKKQVNE